MTDYEYIETDLSDGVFTLTFNRPDALNAFIPPMLEEITDVLNQAKGSGANVLILQGKGRAFSAGVDLKHLGEINPVAGRVGGKFDGPAFKSAEAIRTCDIPVIAKVHGFCFTGALEFALHCDMIYTTVDTKFGDTHAKFGIRPTWGMTQTLPRAVGMRRAKELSYTARTFTGEEAEAWGLANGALKDKDALDSYVSDIAAKIAANSAATIAAYKDLHTLTSENWPLEKALHEEVERDYPDIKDTMERLAGFGKKSL